MPPEAETVEAPTSLATAGEPPVTPPAPEGPDPGAPAPQSTPTHEPGKPDHTSEPGTERPEEPDKPTEPAETYEDFTVPEGISLDTDTTAAFTREAKAAGLNQAQAQTFVDMAVGLQHKWVEAQTNAITQELAKAGGALVPDSYQQSWREQAKLDAEYGGAKFTENLATVKRGLDAYGSPGLVQLLDASGIGNHPEVLRLLFKVGKTVSEDSFVAGKSRGDQPKDAAAILYPNQKAS